MSKPRPANWKKTFADLTEEMEQGQRLFVDENEINWAREYERSLLPSDTVFPCGGQVWEGRDDCEVLVQLWFTAPASGSERGRIAKGERVRICDGVEGEPIRVSFLPLRYDELHAILVPQAVRSEPRYGGYSLSLSTALFNQHFRLLE